MSYSSAFKRSTGHFLKKIITYFEILGPTILLQIYPFLGDIMDEHGVILSSTLHPTGIVYDVKSNDRYSAYNTIRKRTLRL